MAIVFVAIANHLTVGGLAAAPALSMVATNGSAVTASCAHVADAPGECKSPADPTLHLSVPQGAEQCPDSGTAASCSVTDIGNPGIEPGVASTPDGALACAATAMSPLSSLAACTDTVLQESSPGNVANSDLAAVTPSLPISTLQPEAKNQHINLTTNSSFAGPGQKVVLTATSNSTVTGTSDAIEIFDQTTGAVAAACTQGSQCIVEYSAKSGAHKFVAFVTSPTTRLPAVGPNLSSNQVEVNWIGLTLSAKSNAVGPGRAVTVIATSTVLADAGYPLQVFDADSKSRLTYCTHGNTCSVSLTQGSAGQRSLVAILARPSATLPAVDTKAQSEPVGVTWLDVTIVENSTYQIGTNVYLTATANADLTNTPWSLGIVDDAGHLIGQPCKTGSTCTTQTTITTGATPAFSAVVGTVPQASDTGLFGQLVQRVAGPAAAPLVDIQAQSNSVKPNRLLWGVDSCKSFTDDPNAGSGLYPQISGILGAPDFWGRYLTNAVCPPLSSTEVAAAHAKHMGILPIYNERDCSNVSGYDTGRAYAAEAVAAAHGIGLPQGKGIAIDIEPPSPACPGAANLDTGLIHGWYDGITLAHYAPIFYGNGTAGSEFATQWCYTVSALPYIGERSYIWSFQPSLLGGYMKSNAPGYGPNRTGCLGYVHAWQYQIGSSSWAAPDVDGDEATSELPLWFP